MRVLLISAYGLHHSGRTPFTPVYPLGLTYVAAALRKAGHGVQVLDLFFEEDPHQATKSAIRDGRPEVIGISFRNIEMVAFFHNISFVDDLRQLVRTCRRHSTAPVVLGGAGFSVMPAEILCAVGADVGIVGEGERSLPALLERLETGAELHDLPGAVVRRNGGTSVCPPAPSANLGELLPARELVTLDPYLAAGGTANLQTKRGCPFRCSYCTYPLIEGSAVRCRRPDEVLSEMRTLYHELGVRLLYVVDNQFNYPQSHARAICEALVAVRDELRMRWSCMLNPAHVTAELALLLRLARCYYVDLGIESGSDRVLANLGKDFTSAHIADTITQLAKVGLPFRTWIVLGGPGETEQTITETLELLDRLDVESVFFGVGFRVYPHTPLEQQMLSEGSLDDGSELLEQPRFHLAMDPETIVGLVAEHCTDRPGWRVAARDVADPVG
jgi:radical SAM superfamily enzyme YgiQ (UPF0313 family)